MEKITEILTNLTEKINGFIKPLWDKLLELLSKEMYILYGACAILLAVIVLAGIIACFRKIPKFFIFLIILLGIIVAIWFFLVYKPSLAA